MHGQLYGRVVQLLGHELSLLLLMMMLLLLLLLVVTQMLLIQVGMVMSVVMVHVMVIRVVGLGMCRIFAELELVLGQRGRMTRRRGGQ